MQIKAIEQYFPVTLLIMLYKLVKPFENVDEIQSVAIQINAAEQGREQWYDCNGKLVSRAFRVANSFPKGGKKIQPKNQDVHVVYAWKSTWVTLETGMTKNTFDRFLSFAFF